MIKIEAHQFLLPLTQTVTTERGHSLVCIPEHEREKLRREFRDRFIDSDIRKDRPDNHAPKLIKLIAVCGALDIDDPQPAITVMLPGED